MNILFTICGRAGSKGVKNKNVRDFLGKPLVLHTLSAIKLFSKHTQYECVIAVNTDSQEMIDILKQNDRDEKIIFVPRLDELANDTVAKGAVITNTLQIVKKQLNINFAMIIDLDITSPLRKIKDIQNLVQKKLNNSCDVVFSVTNARRNPYFNMVTKQQDYYKPVIKSNFTARQQAPEVFDMNACMYAYSEEFLLSGKHLFDGNCVVIKMQDTAVLDIDSQEDFELMQVIAQWLCDNDVEFQEVLQCN